MKFHFYYLALLLVPSFAFSYTFDRTVSKKLQDQINADLAFVQSIESSQQSDLHKQIFGAVSGESYSRFFNSRVRSIGMNNCGSPSAVACVIPLLGSSKMWLSQNYTKFDHPQIARLMIVFHEARHTEIQKGNWPHAECPTPFNDPQGNPIKSIWTGAKLAGLPACDDSPYGSYGSSLIMLKNISKFCENCTEKVKIDAGLYGDNQLGRIIDENARENIIHDLSP